MIPVLKPQLPSADKLLPYLQQLDVARWYSNFGELTTQFTIRLASLFKITSHQIMLGSNGTVLLELALRTFSPTPGFCIMPSWTFSATACAVVNAGLTPYFMDVDQKTQQFSAAMLFNQLPNIQQQGQIAAVIVVSPFGDIVNRSEWDRFTEQTGIPVLIDAAAAFDTVASVPAMAVGKTPMMISLHATKVFGVGEGGILLSNDSNWITRMREMTQFGFKQGQRVSSHAESTNAKISEYTAAVGLASLDSWPEQRHAWCRIRDNYLQLLEPLNIKAIVGHDWITATFNIILPNQATSMQDKLAELGIQTRRWWEEGCHTQPAFKHYPRFDNLSNTVFLGQSVLGLPCYPDLTLEAQKEIINVIQQFNSHAGSLR